MSWDDLQGEGVVAARSEVDTARFGVVVARVRVGSGTTDEQAARRVADEMERIAPTVAVTRWPAERIGLATEMRRRGLQVQPADTLVYWAADADGPATPSADGPVRLGTSPDLEAEVLDLVASVFAGYPTHYLASPVFTPALVTEGYVDWARRTVREDPDAVLVQLVEGHAAALATTARVDAGRATEVLLAGTRRDHRRRGVYCALLSGVLATASTEGVERVLISTQASNVAAQRAWCALGLRPVAAWTTVHLSRA
ncbi:hypothetical protein KMZ32_10580 [Phycicoccus sp. MAQZ13P-2]|uniref:GNAT family N-acetyltransferase n=1 Tax=Phycicoccus mangrovi TaxID=2840470 RepID=UPI001BFFEED6|nr:GNAT family N-acetyltransferase [Phycicoccus mangrovi]MBT9255920.1 hypothetical protein [Phycicoccus mangrovi]MBT9274514.1 hypothetical protein [Phycicoccus mangrovi]